MLRQGLGNSRLNAGEGNCVPYPGSPSRVGKKANHVLANTDKTQPRFEVVGWLVVILSGPVVQPPHLLGAKLAAQGQLTDTGCC